MARTLRLSIDMRRTCSGEAPAQGLPRAALRGLCLVWICLALVVMGMPVRAQDASVTLPQIGDPEAPGTPPAISILPDMDRHYRGFQGSLVLFQVSSGKTLRHNPELAATPISPASTFKIPHTLIALEAGVVSGPAFELPWDGQERMVRAWNQDHTLATAIKHSVVWYFQEVARRVGDERMRDGLKRLEYGNMDMTGGLDSFWLSSSLKISADDQVLFLRRLMAEVLPFPRDHQRAVKHLMELHRSDYMVLLGKTGTGIDDFNEPNLGWFVGALETSNDRYVFAANILGQGATGRRARRIMLAVLARLDLLN